ncbi:unnamed protein product, partial [Anisakis simplex]|uniref:DH domain-containing protein n=1 Tax=Anisakis simplex TaxID=6269 RepID=A0A0M3JHC6_ANISI
MPLKRQRSISNPDVFTSSQARKRRTKLDVEIYRTILAVMRNELTYLSHKLAAYPMRDYAGVFNVIVSAIQEPFTYEMMDIEEKCREMLSSKGFSDEQLERLHQIITDPNDHFQ